MVMSGHSEQLNKGDFYFGWATPFPPDFPMARKKISTTVYVTPEQNEALHLLHGRTKVPVAVYIREGIDLVLKKYADQLPGQLSLVDTDKK
jgi:hypothetical protein